MRLSSASPVGLYEKALPPEWSWEKRLTAAAQAGYDFVELSIDETDARLERLDWGAAERAALRRAMADSGLPILTMCLGAMRRYPLGSHSPETVRCGLEVLRRAIEFALDIGVRIIQLGGYDVFYEQHDAGTVARYLTQMHQATRWAQQAGVMLALENVDVPLSASMEASMKIVRAMDSPWFQMYADMANLAGMGCDPCAGLALAGKHLVAVHVKDALPNILRGIPFGAGIVPFPDVFHTLAAMQFSGPLMVEMWADRDQTGDALGAACAARDFVRAHVDAAWAGGPETTYTDEYGRR